MTRQTWWKRVEASRAPDFTVHRPGESDNPYLERWWLIPRNRIFNVYLHKFLRGDDDDVLHDHMYFNVSRILEGHYMEETVAAGGVHNYEHRYAGDVVFRSPWRAHRIHLATGAVCYSLFVTGPCVRDWGFHCRTGWKHWKEFLERKGHGGYGC